MRVAVLGAGPGGYVAALKMAQLGAGVTVIENHEVGGTCLNRGCIPTKTLVASTELLAKTRELASFGIDLSGSIAPNLSGIMQRKNKVVSTQIKGIRALFKSWGVALRQGRGSLVSPQEVMISAEDGSSGVITAERIIIATGSRPAPMPALPFDGKHILSSTDALELTEIPRSLLIIGAGAIGCEFACIYRELGSEVTLVEMMDRAVPAEDAEISELLERELKKKKIRLYTGVRVERADLRDDGVHVVLSDGRELVSEKVLVSIGRALNTGDIGLETVGIRKGNKGEIVVNENMETELPGVYAVGDVTGGLLLAHVASEQGLVAAKNIMGIPAVMDSRVIPAAIFTSPEIASVGLREHQAVAQGLKIRTGRFPFRGLGRAHAMGEIAGVIKVIADEHTDGILGVHIIGPHASDLIHEFAVAMRKGLTARDIAETVHAHPTLAEGLREASEDVHGEAVHLTRK
ncbi:MAG: dihydrolipoyl dehydrogenase [Nitrospirae bacterium]|nr:MAG: dihydrolipoyl dehydrogenase [Nitrospirota bacterium]